MRAVVVVAAVASASSLTPAFAVVGGAADAVGARSAVMLRTPRGGLCTGVLVAPAAVLTAGHCAAGDATKLLVRVNGANVPVAAVAVHPGYVADAIRKRVRSIDLALVRLAQPVADAPLAALAGSGPADGAAILAGGFGLAGAGAARSEGTYRSVTMRVTEPHGRSKILVWAKPNGSPPAGICDGDSGGPLRLSGGPDAPVFAIATWAVDGCGGEAQGVLVGPQKAWIDRTLAAWGSSAVWRR
jgi:hypothetical protein